MTRCLVVVSRSGVAEPLAASLSGSGFELDRCSKSEEITRALNKNLPDAVVIDLHDHLGLRMIALAESLRLRVPVLALCEGTVWSRPLPFALSPFLRIYSLSSGEHEWRSQVEEALASAARAPAGGMFRGSDYVQLAVLNELSVAIHGRLDEHVDVHVEIVGGDVWNAYAGEAEGELALTEMMPKSTLEVEVSLLLSVPAGRQIRRPGWDLLEAFGRRANLGEGLPVPKSEALGTRPISISEIRELVERENAVAGDERQPETFDQLLERGFAKALARNYEDAAEAFERALALRPEDTRVKFNLEKVRRRLEERT